LEEQVVAFRLAKEEYAVPIAQVREIIVYQGATQMPGVPDYVEGIINLRGKLMSVIDLAMFFALPKTEQEGQKALILESGNVQFGVLVDEVTEVLHIPAEEIVPPPELEGIRQNQIRGIGKVNDRLIFILEPERLLRQHAEFLNIQAG